MLTFVYKKKKKKNSDQTKLQLSWQNKIRTNLCCNFPQKTKFGLTCVGIFHTKQNCNLCCNFPHKTKFGSTYVGLFHTKKKNKIRINLCCNCPDKKNSDQPMLNFFLQKKRKFESSYIAIVLTKQNSDQPMLQFSTQNKIRINLCWNFPHKTKFGSTSDGLFSTKKKFGSSYIAIVLTKQNSDQPILQFSTQNKIWINLCCNFPHKTKCGSTSIGFFYTKRKKFGSSYIAIVLSEQNSDQPMLQFSTQKKIRINLCCNFPSKQNSRNVPSYVRTCFSRDS